jgi:hypothetical protein
MQSNVLALTNAIIGMPLDVLSIRRRVLPLVVTGKITPPRVFRK